MADVIQRQLFGTDDTQHSRTELSALLSKKMKMEPQYLILDASFFTILISKGIITFNL